MDSNYKLWGWIVIIVLIILLFVSIIVGITIHYNRLDKITQEQVEKIKKERDDSVSRLKIISDEYTEMQKKHQETLILLENRENTLKTTLLELDILSRETDEKINNPPSLDIDSIGSWIKTKIGSTGTNTPP
jgi:hypothetical protein